MSEPWNKPVDNSPPQQASTDYNQPAPVTGTQPEPASYSQTVGGHQPAGGYQPGSDVGRYPQHQSPSYAPHSGQGAITPPKKKSVLVGGIALLFVVVAAILVGTAAWLNVGSLLKFERMGSVSVILLVGGVALWMLSVILAIIAMCARRGTVMGAIAMVLAILPSLIAGAIAAFFALTVTAISI